MPSPHQQLPDSGRSGSLGSALPAEIGRDRYGSSPKKWYLYSLLLSDPPSQRQRLRAKYI